MHVDKETLKKISHLARLEYEEDKAESLMNSLSDILSWVEKLSELDTGGVEPLTNMSYEVNSLREDKAAHALPREEGLKNAPDQDGTYVRVPKVID